MTPGRIAATIAAAAATVFGGDRLIAALDKMPSPCGGAPRLHEGWIVLQAIASLGLAACLLATTREGIEPGHRRLALLGAGVLLVVTLAIFLRADLMAYDVAAC